MTEDEVFSRRCFDIARRQLRKRPFEDGDRICCVNIPQFRKISDDEDVQVRYWIMRLKGESHNIAEMLALRTFCSINGTNKAFNRGRANGNQFENCPALGDYYRRIAETAGVSTTGRYYCHGLGRYPGDPRAWVADTSDVLAIARDRNLSIDGIVTHRGEPVEPAPDVPLAEDIWERETNAILAESPGMRYEDAREKAFNLRTGRDDPNPQLVSDSVPHPAEVLDA